MENKHKCHKMDKNMRNIVELVLELAMEPKIPMPKRPQSTKSTENKNIYNDKIITKLLF